MRWIKRKNMQDNRTLSTEEWLNLLAEDKKKRNPYKVIAQRGGQNDMLACDADVMIGGGSRGGGKSMSILMEGLYDIYNPRFRAIILRNQIPDLDGLINDSKIIYKDFGTLNISKNDLTWNFNKGGQLQFSYYASDSWTAFEKRFQGKQYSYIAIDEITHSPWEKFRYLLSCNRNAYGIRNRFWGTCNPDPDSWVAKFIEWWIGDDGYPIKERNGVKRYFFIKNGSLYDIVWGNSREEVYEKCKGEIDEIYTDDYRQYGEPWDVFVKSAAFVEAKLADNYQLMRDDPSYLGNLAAQSEEKRERDLRGNWKFKSAGDDYIKYEDMERFYENAYQYGDGHKTASCDVAFDGGDNLVLALFIGNHIREIVTFSHDSRESILFVKSKLSEWGVREEDFTYDLSGIGQSFKGFFPKAVPFNNRESVQEKDKGAYDTIKSQCAYMFADALIHGEISIDATLLDRRFSGKNYQNVRLRDILMGERKAIRKDPDSDRGFVLIKKQMMKKLVGHSPDFIECFLMQQIFKLKKRHKRWIGFGML